MKPFILAWGVAWVVVGVGALRAIGSLWSATGPDAPTPDREALRAATRRALRWAYAMAGLGMLMAVVSPWL